ncbi:hypothetical protein KUTeg_013885 [Tegillarca granosa]|uniref:Uncharacterized protein n=1 Tax=Tegillarca granosa TaxID=220873 RepID=A0ABQ9EYI4_TEGGR|nr:hypothetical protein KUTeg_013885 [Tegillarca granosa]
MAVYYGLQWTDSKLMLYNDGAFTTVSGSLRLFSLVLLKGIPDDVSEKMIKSFDQENQNNDSSNETLNQVVQEAKHRFFLRLGSYDDVTLREMSQNDFKLIRDERYGYCFTFSPSSTAEIAGPQFGNSFFLPSNTILILLEKLIL